MAALFPVGNGRDRFEVSGERQIVIFVILPVAVTVVAVGHLFSQHGCAERLLYGDLGLSANRASIR